MTSQYGNEDFSSEQDTSASAATGADSVAHGSRDSQGSHGVGGSHDSHGSHEAPKKADSDSKANIGLAALVALAILASVVMLISGSAAALKIALVASLWAAVIGFFLVVRYRRQAQEAAERMELQERAHQAELDEAYYYTEHAGGTEVDRDFQELSDFRIPDAAQMQALQEIREELKVIRAQIEELAGREFTYEPATLRAEARRIMELEARSMAAGQAIGNASAAGYGMATQEAAGRASAADDAASATSTEEPEINYTQTSAGAPSSDAIAGRLGTQQTPTTKAAQRATNPLVDILSGKADDKTGPSPAPKADAKTEPKTEPHFDTSSFQALRWDAGGTQGKPSTEASSEHGRRRRDAHREGSVSVAELLAKKGKK